MHLFQYHGDFPSPATIHLNSCLGGQPFWRCSKGIFEMNFVANIKNCHPSIYLDDRISLSTSKDLTTLSPLPVSHNWCRLGKPSGFKSPRGDGFAIRSVSIYTLLCGTANELKTQLTLRIHGNITWDPNRAQSASSLKDNPELQVPILGSMHSPLIPAPVEHCGLRQQTN
jgi:hypothetical protein